MTIDEVMEYLIERSPTTLPPSALAEVLDRLIWCLDNNGDDLLDIRDAWLRGDDKQKVQVALAMNEVYPFGGGDRMQAELKRLAERWPDLKSRCESILSEWGPCIRFAVA